MLYLRGEIQIKRDNFEIDSLDYAINSQELNGKSVAGWCTAVRLTAQRGVMVGGLHILMNVLRQTCAVGKTLYFLTGG